MGQLLRLPSPRLQRGHIKPSRPVVDWAHPLARGLRGYWPLGDGVSVSQDVTGYGGVATHNNGPVGSFSHHGGQSHKYDGSNDFSQVTRNAWLEPAASFTLVCWINMPTTTQAQYCKPVCKDYNNNSNPYLSYGWSWNDHADSKWVFGGAFGGTNYGVTHATAASANVWLMLGGVYDNVANTIAPYTNGQADGTPATTSGNPTYFSTDLFFGAQNAGQLFFNGYVEGVRLYDRALSAAEMARLYAEPYVGIMNYPLRNLVGVAAGGGASVVPILDRQYRARWAG